VGQLRCLICRAEQPTPLTGTALVVCDTCRFSISRNLETVSSVADEMKAAAEKLDRAVLSVVRLHAHLRGGKNGDV